MKNFITFILHTYTNLLMLHLIKQDLTFDLMVFPFLKVVIITQITSGHHSKHSDYVIHM